MDYRKSTVFGQNWSPSRYKILRYFEVEKAIVTQPQVQRILDLGCAAGWNMSRFAQYGRQPIGLDMAVERLKLARVFGPVMIANGLRLPFAAHAFDLVYIQHVLHHLGDIRQALREVYRCLAPDGTLFLIETVEDNPFVHWGRALHPAWMGDAVTARFRFVELQTLLAAEGFQVVEAEQYSVFFWLWEMLRDQMLFLEKATPVFVTLEQRLATVWRRYGAHCFVVARPLPVPPLPGLPLNVAAAPAGQAT